MGTRFNIATLPAELLAKQNAKWNAVGAIAELIDNIFGELRGNADNATLAYDSHARILTILDDGQGTDHIGRMFQFGNTIGAGGFDPGKYGVGGKHANLWLSFKTQVWSLRDGKVMYDTVVWKDVFKAKSFADISVSDEWVRASLANTPAELLANKHGVMIRLHLLPRRKIDAGKITRDLAKMFSTGLRNGKTITWNTMRKNEIVDTKELHDPIVKPSAKAQSMTFDLVVEHTDDDDNPVHLPVRGRVFYDETTTQSESKIYLGYGYRVIRTANECFRSADGSEKYPGVGISGWLDLGKEWRDFLSSHKDEIDDAVLFDTLMAYVFEEIKPLLKQSQRKMFTLQFEDLAIGLEKALNLKTGDLVVQVAAGKGHIRDGDGTIVKVGESGGKDEGGKLNDKPGDKPKKSPPLLGIQLIPLSDEQMEQHLCRAQFAKGTDVDIYINEDHHVIEEAMVSKPVNKMVLHQVVIDELANEIVSLVNYDEVVRAMLLPTALKAVNEKESPRDRARMLTRVLIDRVRNPLAAAEAAE